MRYSKSITITVVDSLKVGDSVRDPLLRGFGVRCNATSKTYFVHTRVNGRQRWITIGKHGVWTPAQARLRAKVILYEASNGIDNGEKKRKLREQKDFFPDAMQSFMDTHGKRLKPRTREEYQRLAKLYLVPTFKTKRLADISEKDVVRAHESWATKPSAANHALALLSTVMTWAETRGLRENSRNPCRNVKPYPEKPIVRFLREDDVKRLGKALNAAIQSGEATAFAVAAIKLYVLTGARRNEILTLKWRYIDRERMVAHLPDSKTGPKALPLNPEAIEILDRLPRVEGNPYCIVGARPGRHLVDLKKPWDFVRKLAGLEGFRLHDLRHSFASFAADIGGTAEAVGGILGHSSIDTTKGYIHLFDKRAVDLSAKTAGRIATLLQD